MVSIITSLNVYVQSIFTKTNYRRNAIQSILAFAVLVLGAQSSFAQAPPQIDFCPPGPVVVTLEDGGGTITFTTINIPTLLGIVASDPDGTETVTYSTDVPSVSCSEVSPPNVTIIITASDSDGDNSTCIVDVEVEKGAPVAECQDVTVMLDAAGNGSTTTGAIDNGSVNCGTTSLSFMADISLTFDCSDVGANPVLLTVTDTDNSLTDDCTATITVQDNVAPVAICQDVTVMLDAAGNGSTTAGAVDNGSSDACGISSLSIVPSNFNCGDVGPNLVTLTVIDVNGNSDTDVCTVTVEDNVPPTAICQDITVSLDVNGEYTLSQMDADNMNNGSSDACGIDNVSVPPNFYDCSDIGPNAVTLTVEDVNGNTDTDNCTVTVEDGMDSPPVISNCPPVSTLVGIPASEGNCFANVGFLSPTAADACSGIATFNGVAVDENMNPIPLTTSASPGLGCTPVSLFAGVFNVANWAFINEDITGAPNNVILQGGFSQMAITIPPDYNGVISFDWIKLNGLLVYSTDNGTTSNFITLGGLDNGTQEIVVEAGDELLIANFGSGVSITNFAFTCAEGTSGDFPVGVNTVTYTATDGFGNTATCTFNVEVLDEEKPSVSPILDQTINLSTLDCADPDVPDFSGLATISDNCGFGAMSISQSPAIGSPIANLAEGSNFMVSITATDASGNDSTVMFTATINDNVAPTINTCPTASTVQIPDDNNGATCTVNPSWTTPTFDDCGDVGDPFVGTFISRSDAMSETDALGLGTTTVTYRYTDAGGNATDCVFSVTVQDNEGPQFTTPPANITADVDMGMCAATVTIPSTYLAADCTTPITFTTSNSTGSYPVGTTTITVTATDGVGNDRTATFDVIVTDNEPPTIACQDITIQLDATGTEAITTTDVVTASGDNCGVATTVLSQTNFGCSDLGDNTETVTITDVNGVTNSCSVTVTVEDNIAPSITCPADLTVTAGPGCEANITMNLTATGTDNCGTPTITNNYAGSGGGADASGIYPLGITTVNFTATDASSNTMSCFTNVTVIDNEAPTINCPSPATFARTADAVCMYTAVSGEFDVTVDVDNCSSATLTHNYGPAPSNTTLDNADFPVGTTNITWTATDGVNSTTCNIAITITDDQAPTQNNVGSPGVPTNGDDIPVSAGPSCSAIVNWVAPTFTDNCQGTVTPTSTNNPGDVFPVGVTTVSYTAIDPSGNSTVVSFTVTVTDGVAPNAGCQPNQINLALNAGGIVNLDAQNDVNLGSFDACGIDSYQISINGGSSFFDDITFDCTTIGFYNVILEVSDGVLTDQCNATVNVVDNLPPTANCMNTTVFLNSGGTGTISISDINNGSTDNGLACLDLFLNQTFFDCDDIGANTVTLTATDAGGNTDFCTATVTVIDDIDPTLFNIPGDVSGVDCNNIPGLPFIDLTSTIFAPDTITATDNCGLDDILFNESNTQSSDPSSCNAYNYTITRSWTAIDVNGNTSVSSQTITVIDNDAPTDPTYAASNNVSNGSTIGVDATTCTATVQLAITDFVDCADFDDLTITNNYNAGGADASGLYGLGVQTVIFFATDPCGNTSNWTVSFTVEDNTAPTASCAGSLNLGLPAVGGELIINPLSVNNNSIDNCSGFNLMLSVTPDTLTCDDVGTTTVVTLMVTDQANNSSTCTTMVTLQENNAPTALGQNITVVLGDDNTVTITPADVDAGSFDDCTDVTLSISQSLFTDADLGPNNVILTVMDENGNSSNTTVIVTVTLPPTCFNIPTDLSGGAGDIVSIPITAEDFTALVGFQFEVLLDSAGIGEFVGISGVDPGLNNVIIGEAVQTDSMIAMIDTMIVDTIIMENPPMSGMFDTTFVEEYDTTFTPLFDAIAVTWAQGNSDPMTGNLVPLTYDSMDILFYIDLMLTGEIGDFSGIKINSGSMTTPSEVVYSFGNTLYDVAFSPCPTSPGFIQIGQLVFSGQVYTENLDPVALVEVDLVDLTLLSGPGNEVDTTEVDGLYALTTTGVDLFKIEPHKDINWPNGIDILDVGLIQRHTVGNPYVGSAYKKIAADVSGDFVITTFDAVLLNAFLASFFDPMATPPTESWQFVDAKQNLMNAQNAFVPPFRDTITLPNVTSDSMDNDFIAIKTGDLGGLQTADVTAIINDDDGSAALARTDNTLKFMIEDRSIQEGQAVNFEVKADNFEQLMAYQWILKFDPQQLRYEGASKNQEGNFTFSEALIEEGQLILTWFAANDVTLTEKDLVFNLEFTALNKMSSIANSFDVATYEQFKAIAYRGDQTPMNVELIITESKPAGAFVLNQNIPNPFKDETVISFYLPESGEANLSIMDVTGRVLKVYRGDFNEGYNEVSINRSELPQAGTLLYELRSSEHTATKKMIIID